MAERDSAGGFGTRLDSTMLPGNFSDTFRLYMIQSNQYLLDTGFTAKNASEKVAQVGSDATEALENAGTALNGVTTLNQAVQALDDAIVAVATDYVSLTKNAAQTIRSPFGAASYSVAGQQVVGSRRGGWQASGGTPKQGGMDADADYGVGGEYNQAQIQAIANGLKEVRKVVLALQQALSGHGLING